MLSERVYIILKLLNDSSVPLCANETPFSTNEFTDLINDGYVYVKDKTVHKVEGEYPLTLPAYSITPKGKDAIILHEAEKARTDEAEKTAKQTLELTRISVKIAIASLIAAVISLLLTILPQIITAILQKQ